MKNNKGITRRLLSVVLALAMVVALMPAMSLTAVAADACGICTACGHAWTHHSNGMYCNICNYEGRCVTVIEGEACTLEAGHTEPAAHSHTHTWSYANGTGADAGKVIATNTCTSKTCRFSETPAGTAYTFTSSDTVTYNGGPVNAYIMWSESNANLPEFTKSYIGREGTTYESSTRPTAIGDYTMTGSIDTDNDGTADFTITKDFSVVTHLGNLQAIPAEVAAGTETAITVSATFKWNNANLKPAYAAVYSATDNKLKLGGYPFTQDGTNYSSTIDGIDVKTLPAGDYMVCIFNSSDSRDLTDKLATHTEYGDNCLAHVPFTILAPKTAAEYDLALPDGVTLPESADTAIPVSLTDSTENITLGEVGKETWYVVNINEEQDPDVTLGTSSPEPIPVTVTLCGNVNLIMTDGSSLAVMGNIVGDGSLTVWGQRNGTGMFASIAMSDSGFDLNDKLTINGGSVYAMAMNCDAIAGDVVINGGSVIAAAIPTDKTVRAFNTSSLTINGNAEVKMGKSTGGLTDVVVLGAGETWQSKLSSSVTEGAIMYQITYPHMHSLCGVADCEEHDTADNAIAFTPWDATASGDYKTTLPNVAGNYYLTDDVNLSTTWKPADGTNLCLNGHVLKGNGSDYVIYVNNGVTFNLCDCDTTEHKFSVNSTGLWELNESAEDGTALSALTGTPEADDVVIVSGGCITDGNGSYGGAIRNDKGTLNIFGGNLVGNKAKNDGGAVRNSGTFNMSGGAILGCVATSNGGAVFNDSTATSFTLSGTGMIGYCHASSGKNGGAVYNVSTFNMCNDAIITGCTAQNGNGGGVFTAKGTFKMSGGEITCNTAKYGGGIALQSTDKNTKVELQGKVSNNSSDERGGGIEVNGGTLVVKADAEITYNTAKFGGGIMLQRNNVDTKVELQGKVSNNTSDTHGGGIKVDGGTLVVKDGAEIVENESKNGGGIFVAGNSNSSGGVTVENGAIISKNNATNNGGGIALQSKYTDTKVEVQGEVSENTSGAHGGGIQINGGTLEVKDGAEIVKNHATINGGGIYSTSDLGTSTITLNGKVSENIADGEGGGIQVYKAGSSLIVGDNAEISKNQAATKGGGICVNQGNVTITNGIICDNTATENGGGVYVHSENVTVGGSAVISDNKNGKGVNNVYLAVGEEGSFTLSIGTSDKAPVTEGDNKMTIYVTTSKKDGEKYTFNSVGDIIAETSTDYSACFQSDDSRKIVKYTEDKLVLANAYRKSSGSSTHTYSVTAPTNVAHGKVSVTPVAPVKGGKVTITTTPDKGYVVGSVTVTDADGNKVEVTANGDNKYYYIAPASKTTVDVTFVKEGEKVDDTALVLTIGKKEANAFGETVVNDVAPIIVNDRTMLPARFVAENLGAKVEWDGDARVVTITKDDTVIVITIDSNKAFVNGEEVTLDSPAFVQNDRTYTPLRFIAENLGAKVEWNEAEQQVIITK